MRLRSEESLNVAGPSLKNVRAIAVTATSANVDVTTLAELPANKLPRMLRLTADGADIYYGWYSDNTLTIDDTNTTAGNSGQCALIPAGQYRDEFIPYINNGLWSFLYYKTKSGLTGTLRITISSQDEAEVVK